MVGFRDLLLADKTFLRKTTWEFLSRNEWARDFLKNHLLRDKWLRLIIFSSLSILLAMNRFFEQFIQKVTWLPRQKPKVDLFGLFLQMARSLAMIFMMSFEKKFYE